jgi:hypothetical protein
VGHLSAGILRALRLMEDDAKELHEKSQSLLVGLLRTDIELAHTFLQTAKITSSASHAASAVEKARNALDSVRHFSGRIQDQSVRSEIHDRADALEAAIGSFVK